ncbi:glutathione S-transferase F13-like [Pistacia vera]|uniref:glutathione S-transferase F13-like n=1 Tax=Pistacia vera TaxID=55513 RepID=UPI0012630E75|nr:glutathione S-transferase F13-like [Pistacia vera]
MVIKVHGLALTTSTARVLLCLSEKNVDYQLLPVDVFNRAHKQQPYLSLSPFGQIPAFEDEDVKLFESRAISRYIANKYKNTGTDLLRSNSLKESAIVETWMEVETQQFDGPIRTIVRHLILNPIVGKPLDEKIVEAELQKLGKVLNVYEERLSKSIYLAGDFYTMADMHHLPYLIYFMKTSKATLVTSRPHVNAWWNNISSRPATIEVSERMTLA